MAMPDLSPGAHDTGSAVRLGVLAGIIASIAALAGLALTDDRLRLVLGGLIGVAVMGYLILRSFEGFILLLLVVRSSLDVIKGDGGGTSAADVTSLVAMAFLVVFGAWYLVQGLGDERGHRYRVRGQGVVLLVFLATVAISVISSQDLLESTIWLIRLASGFLMFFAVDRLLRQGTSPWRIVGAILGAAVIPLLFVVYGELTGNPRIEVKEGIDRVRSTFAQSNPFGHFLVVVLLLAIALFPVLRTRARVWVSALIALGTASLILTQTRSAWFAFALGVLVIAWNHSKALVGALAVAMVLVVAAVPTVQARLDNLVDDGGQRRNVNSLEWRFGIWAESFELAESNPVTGVGIGITPQLTENNKPPHSDVVRAYAELGIVGFLAYATMLGSFVLTGVRALRAATTPFDRAIASGFLGYALAYAGASFGENLLTQVVVLWYAMAFLALARWVIERPRPPVEALPPAPAAAVPA